MSRSSPVAYTWCSRCKFDSWPNFRCLIFVKGTLAEKYCFHDIAGLFMPSWKRRICLVYAAGFLWYLTCWHTKTTLDGHSDGCAVSARPRLLSIWLCRLPCVACRKLWLLQSPSVLFPFTHGIPAVGCISAFVWVRRQFGCVWTSISRGRPFRPVSLSLDHTILGSVAIQVQWFFLMHFPSLVMFLCGSSHCWVINTKNEVMDATSNKAVATPQGHYWDLTQNLIRLSPLLPLPREEAEKLLR